MRKRKDEWRRLETARTARLAGPIPPTPNPRRRKFRDAASRSRRASIPPRAWHELAQFPAFPAFSSTRAVARRRRAPRGDEFEQGVRFSFRSSRRATPGAGAPRKAYQTGEASATQARGGESEARLRALSHFDRIGTQGEARRGVESFASPQIARRGRRAPEWEARRTVPTREASPERRRVAGEEAGVGALAGSGRLVGAEGLARRDRAGGVRRSRLVAGVRGGAEKARFLSPATLEVSGGADASSRLFRAASPGARGGEALPTRLEARELRAFVERGVEAGVEADVEAGVERFDEPVVDRGAATAAGRAPEFAPGRVVGSSGGVAEFVDVDFTDVDFTGFELASRRNRLRADVSRRRAAGAGRLAPRRRGVFPAPFSPSPESASPESSSRRSFEGAVAFRSRAGSVASLESRSTASRRDGRLELSPDARSLSGLWVGTEAGAREVASPALLALFSVGVGEVASPALGIRSALRFHERGAFSGADSRGRFRERSGAETRSASGRGGGWDPVAFGDDSGRFGILGRNDSSVEALLRECRDALKLIARNQGLDVTLDA